MQIIVHDCYSLYQNKMLYNNIFFGTNFTDLLIFSCIQRTHPKFNNAITLGSEI